MKKVLSSLLAALLLASFIGCTDTTSPQKNTQTPSPDAPKKDSC